MATLTGAVVIALGSHASGVMTNNQYLADKIIESGEDNGDRAWQLPLWNEYKSCTKTNFADLANIGEKLAPFTLQPFFQNLLKIGHIWILQLLHGQVPLKEGLVDQCLLFAI